LLVRFSTLPKHSLAVFSIWLLSRKKKRKKISAKIVLVKKLNISINSCPIDFKFCMLPNLTKPNEPTTINRCLDIANGDLPSVYRFGINFPNFLFLNFHQNSYLLHTHIFGNFKLNDLNANLQGQNLTSLIWLTKVGKTGIIFIDFKFNIKLLFRMCIKFWVKT